MYYIVNQTNHIIAADDVLLESLSIENMNELHKSIALETITFTLTENELSIHTPEGTLSYTVSSHILSSLLGEMKLIEIVQKEETETEPIAEESDLFDDTFSLIDDEAIDEEPITFEDGTDKLIEELAQEKEEPISLLDDEQPFDLISDDTPLTAEETTEEEIPEEKLQEDLEDTTPIIINIGEISQNIGISTEDYNSFLNEYIDTALTLEEDLKSTQTKKRSHAIATLSHLSNVLHLPVVSEIMEKIEKSDEDKQSVHIQSLYQTLARLTTSTGTKSQTDDKIEEKTEEKLEVTTEELQEEETAASQDSFGTIDLSDVKPIHFDFQLEEAANDLSLPVELIEEFVIDFIDQAHVETEKMLEAYEKGDLDAIQKIGHLLKGTSSNLRINPLADTLYKIQFCEDSSQLENLIKEYWAHFLSFENQIKLTSK